MVSASLPVVVLIVCSTLAEREFKTTSTHCHKFNNCKIVVAAVVTIAVKETKCQSPHPHLIHQNFILVNKIINNSKTTFQDLVAAIIPLETVFHYHLVPNKP